jgi:hypothetical protein
LQDLQALTALIRCLRPEQVDLSILIVVDNPSAPSLDAIRSLFTLRTAWCACASCLVNVAYSPLVRNILDQSWVRGPSRRRRPLQLSSPAYVGAIARYPRCWLCWFTEPPPPASTLMQHALQACVRHVPLYGIAAKWINLSWASPLTSACANQPQFHHQVRCERWLTSP